MFIFKRTKGSHLALTWRSAFLLVIHLATKDGNSIIQLPESSLFQKEQSLMKDTILESNHLLSMPFLLLPVFSLSMVVRCQIWEGMIQLEIYHLNPRFLHLLYSCLFQLLTMMNTILLLNQYHT